jgi:penicillin-binding protein A
MNASIVRLFGFCIVLFALLVAWTSRWTVLESKAITDNALNQRPFFAELKIRRGRILADDGTVLAESVRHRDGTWGRKYPTGSLFAQIVGYDIPAEKGVMAGLEKSRSDQLNGQPNGIENSIFGELSTAPQVGDDVYTTLDPTAQRLAVSELEGRAGAVVALDPRTGAVKALYANPSYDDNHPKGAATFDSALQGFFPPGSTFKVVTATAALDTGRYTPTSIINGNSPITESGVPLENDNGDSYGPVTLTKALTDSINTVFAQVGDALGRQTMETYMKRFGFYSVPPLDFPHNEMIASGERDLSRKGGPLLPPTNDSVDLGRMAIGQDKLLVTPMQMAMVVSAVANGGKLMKPYVTTKVVNQDGQTVESFSPTVFSRVMKPSTAAALTSMMTDVVEEGTGTAANLEGVKVAGKTGTAQIVTGSDLDDAWFIGFAPVADPKVAVAVMLEKIPNGYGGQYAAPIAAQMIKTLLSEGQ